MVSEKKVSRCATCVLFECFQKSAVFTKAALRKAFAYPVAVCEISLGKTDSSCVDIVVYRDSGMGFEETAQISAGDKERLG